MAVMRLIPLHIKKVSHLSDACQSGSTIHRTLKRQKEANLSAEKRLAEIQVLKKHMVNYRKTKDTYVTYRKSGYSNRFFEELREELTLHKAAKKAFNQLNAERLPTIRELNEEYSRVLTQKKEDYAEYLNAKKEMRESVTAGKNEEMFYKTDGIELYGVIREKQKEI